MSGYLIIQWPDGDKKILDHIPGSQESCDYQTLQKYSVIFNCHVEWVGADQKSWLREHGYL